MMHLFKRLPGKSALAITVAGTAVDATAMSNPQPTHVRIQVLTGDIRWSADGTTPVGGNDATGDLLPAVTSEVWTYSLYAESKFIREGSTSATLRVLPLTYA